MCLKWVDLTVNTVMSGILSVVSSLQEHRLHYIGYHHYFCLLLKVKDYLSITVLINLSHPNTSSKLDFKNNQSHAAPPTLSAQAFDFKFLTCLCVVLWCHHRISKPSPAFLGAVLIKCHTDIKVREWASTISSLLLQEVGRDIKKKCVCHAFRDYRLPTDKGFVVETNRGRL